MPKALQNEDPLIGFLVIAIYYSGMGLWEGGGLQRMGADTLEAEACH